MGWLLLLQIVVCPHEARRERVCWQAFRRNDFILLAGRKVGEPIYRGQWEAQEPGES